MGDGIEPRARTSGKNDALHRCASLRVVLCDPLAVGAGSHAFDPGGVVQVPADGLAQAGFELFGRLPAQFARDLGGVDGVAAVVAGAVLDEGDQASARAEPASGRISSSRSQMVWTTSMLVALAVAADVVGLADAAAFEHGADGGAVVFDKEPVAHVPAVAVDGQRLASSALRSSAGSAFRGTERGRSCWSSWW